MKKIGILLHETSIINFAFVLEVNKEVLSFYINRAIDYISSIWL